MHWRFAGQSYGSRCAGCAVSFRPPQQSALSSAKIQRQSGGAVQEGVLVVKAVQYRVHYHSTCSVETMPLALKRHGETHNLIGKAGPQRKVWSAAIVMRSPSTQSFSQMLFGEGNDPIQALPPEGPDQPFAERIRLRAVHRCFDDFKTQVRYRSIELGREDRFAVMQDKTVRVI